jgi:hypothetical protein
VALVLLIIRLEMVKDLVIDLKGMDQRIQEEIKEKINIF